MANNTIGPTNISINNLKALTNGNDAASGSDAAAGSPSFGDVLKQSISSAIDAQHNSEKMSAAALTGKADMTDVMQSVNNAEMALNTVLAVRDRVVQAYDQIMRTSI